MVLRFEPECLRHLDFSLSLKQYQYITGYVTPTYYHRCRVCMIWYDGVSTGTMYGPRPQLLPPAPPPIDQTG